MRQGDPWSVELILVYCGKGKGKTSACVGQALRAAGSGLKVAFGQFIKRENVAGEQKMLASLPSIQYKACGLGFLRGTLPWTAHREKAQSLLAWAATLEVDMLVLDEALNALHYGLICRNDLSPWLKAQASEKNHLVLSGKDAPSWLVEMTDTLTEMLQVKHQHDAGAPALPGLEF